jgi:hypothetical protein
VDTLDRPLFQIFPVFGKRLLNRIRPDDKKQKGAKRRKKSSNHGDSPWDRTVGGRDAAKLRRPAR